MTKRIEVALNYLTYTTSLIFVSVSIASELTRIGNYRSIINFDSYTIFIIGSTYTGIFVRSFNYNVAMALLASPVFFAALRYGVIIEPGELGRQIKSWTLLVGIYALGGWICNFIYITSKLVDLFLDRLEYFLPESIRRKKKQQPHVVVKSDHGVRNGSIAAILFSARIRHALPLNVDRRLAAT